MPSKRHYTYVDIHKTVQRLVDQVIEFRPDVMVAIGGGGYIPARMLRGMLTARGMKVCIPVERRRQTPCPYVRMFRARSAE
eukprot:6188463-Pyramimonas_sp.AAC.1